MKNYLSFSLWGDKPIYNVGAIRNAELWKEIYPNWQMIVYYDNSVPKETINKLESLGVTLKKMSNMIYPCFWRFLILDDITCKYAIFRDCDSRISYREKLAVDEWIKSDKCVHVMRDHPYHKIPAGNNNLGILAGMWGMKGGHINIEKNIKDFILNKSDFYGIDQMFLKFIYDFYQDNMLIHDEFFNGIPFPTSRQEKRFIGERIDENDNPLTKDYLML